MDVLLVPEGVIYKILLPELYVSCEGEMVQGLVEPLHLVNSLGILHLACLRTGLENMVDSCAGVQECQQY